MKRVCMVVQSLYPGDERVRRQAERLERDSVEVDIICLRGEGQSKSERYGLVTVHRVLATRPKERLRSYLWLCSLFAGAAFLRLQLLAARRHYDAVQVHNMPDFLVGVAIVQKLLGKPVVLDLHDLSIELFASKLNGSNTRLAMSLVKTTEKLSCALADEIITTSVGFKERLIGRGIAEDKITLVINTADPHIFQFQSDREFSSITKGARLLYHGTVAPRFGILRAIEAVGLLQEKIPESSLHVYGQYDPSYRAELERKIADLGLSGRVLLHGWVSLEEIREVIHRSDVGLVPYLSDDFMNLALSTKTFEYAATGLPVVASRLAPVESVFDDSCIQFAVPGDAGDLAKQVTELCLDPDRRRELTRQARKALDGISGEVMLGRYMSLMNKLMGSNGRS